MGTLFSNSGTVWSSTNGYDEDVMDGSYYIYYYDFYFRRWIKDYYSSTRHTVKLESI